MTGIFTMGALVMENSDGTGGFVSLEDDLNNFDGNPDWAPDASPVCQETSVTTGFASPVSIQLRCEDQGPAYERTAVTESVRDQPTNGTLGPIQQGDPSTVVYTPNSNFSGTDTFTFRGFDARSFAQTVTVTINVLPAGVEPPPPADCANLQTGTSSADTLTGTDAGDRLRGLGGNDVLDGGAGNDCLVGGKGNDRLTGGLGDDRLTGGKGNDRLRGGSGDDRLSGGKGNDVLKGGEGKNTYFAGPGDDKVRARNGRPETINCGKGRRDRARVDRSDTVVGCETVTRP